jgi:hypothetical protein
VITRSFRLFVLYSRSNGLLNFHSNGLQIVALVSVLFPYFILSIHSNVFRRNERVITISHLNWRCNRYKVHSSVYRAFSFRREIKRTQERQFVTHLSENLITHLSENTRQIITEPSNHSGPLPLCPS